jgi:hypothetical protein
MISQIANVAVWEQRWVFAILSELPPGPLLGAEIMSKGRRGGSTA